MPRTKSTGPKRNLWKDPSPYGTYTGEVGSAETWSKAYEQAYYSREKSQDILCHYSETPYMILGIITTASQEEIKLAFRKLALVHHPDKGGDRDMFEKIMAAYSILAHL